MPASPPARARSAAPHDDVGSPAGTRSLACSSAPWHRPPISPTVGAPCCRALRSALMDGSGRWRNLGIASGALAAALFAGFDLFQWVAAYGSDHFHNDFTFYYAAARIGVTHG